MPRGATSTTATTLAEWLILPIFRLQGDRLIIIDDSDADWWRARHSVSNRQGFIPRNYVAAEKSVESEDWFFGRISRKDAEKMLMMETNPRGTFLIRHREQTQAGGYSLSIKDFESSKGDHVKHYKIKTLDQGGFYVTTKMTFSSLQQLVAYYSEGSLKFAEISLYIACLFHFFLSL